MPCVVKGKKLIYEAIIIYIFKFIKKMCRIWGAPQGKVVKWSPRKGRYNLL